MKPAAVDYNDCDNCGSDEWDNGVCSLDGLGFCCEECLDAYLNGGRGILSANPQDRYNPEPYETSFYVYENERYRLRDDISLDLSDKQSDELKVALDPFLKLTDKFKMDEEAIIDFLKENVKKDKAS